MNTIGNILRLTTFGESHGPAIGGVLDGLPSGICLDFDMLRLEMARRKPGSSKLTTQRQEDDEVEILSGVYEGTTIGTPLAFIIHNKDHRPEDYAEMQHTFRPGHADYTYFAKYGIRDFRGGGRASARETAVRVAAGAICRQALASKGIQIHAWPSQIGTATLEDNCRPELLEKEILRAKEELDSIGSIVSCRISGLPQGLGEPVYGKFQSMLASAMMSLNAAKGFDYGSGFDGAALRGSELLDVPTGFDKSGLHTENNFAGGILGGITTGEDVCFRVVFKPIATLPRTVRTVNDSNRTTELRARGRHDPCVVPRVLPVVEAMAAFVTLDAILLNRSRRW